MNLAPLTDQVPGAAVDDSYGRTSVDVPAAGWQAAVRLARVELGCDWFDFLTAVDDPEGPVVVCHVACTQPFGALMLRTRLDQERPSIGSVAGTYAGAAWHERETAEMFGIAFVDTDGAAVPMEPLLLPPGFEGHPLRKDFVLQAREERPWPGAKEPGGS